MPLSILTDEDVRALLNTLTKDDVHNMQLCLANALHSYSTAIDYQDNACCATNQPQRMVVPRKDGSVNLFMPATTDEAMGVKVMTVSESTESAMPSQEVESLTLSDNPSDSDSASFSSPTRTDTASSSSSTTMVDSSSTSQRTGSTATSTSSPSRADSQSAALAANLKEPIGEDFLRPAPTSPKGSITLLDLQGQPRALLNASTLTAFRTALASTMLLKKRRDVHNLTVFGAGLQAYWHIYLTILLRGPELRHLHLVNRDFSRAQRLLITLAQSKNPEISDTFLTGKFHPSILTPEYNEYHRLLKEHVRSSDLIYCCTPSTTPLFPASYLTNPEGRKKARYVVAIGSYKPHMQELHPDILKQAVSGPPDDRHSHSHSHGPHLHLHHRHAQEGGAVIVDTIEGAMREAGEVIKAGISGQGIVEIGELVMLKRSHWAEKAERERLAIERGETKQKSGGHGLGHFFHGLKKDDKEHKPPKDNDDGGLHSWLERGNVIYKSVGLGLMDVVVGMELVKLAEERGFGAKVDDF